MIETVHRVYLNRNGKEKQVLETADLKEAKRKDAQLDIAMSLMFETERMVKGKEVPLPEGVKLDQVEEFLEEVFIKMAEDPEGLKRAIKGQSFKDESNLVSQPAAKKAKGARVKKETQSA